MEALFEVKGTVCTEDHAAPLQTSIGRDWNSVAELKRVAGAPKIERVARIPARAVRESVQLPSPSITAGDRDRVDLTANGSAKARIGKCSDDLKLRQALHGLWKDVDEALAADADVLVIVVRSVYRKTVFPAA